MLVLVQWAFPRIFTRINSFVCVFFSLRGQYAVHYKDAGRPELNAEGIAITLEYDMSFRLTATSQEKDRDRATTFHL